MPRTQTFAKRLCVVAAAAAAAAVGLFLSVGFTTVPFLGASKKLAAPGVVADLTRPSKTLTMNATCSDWAEWIPPRSEPAVVMQVVSEDYVDVTRNFIRLMERNSALTRHHLFLMCMDDESVAFFETSMGIRCVPMSAIDLPTHEAIWKLRVKVVSCLLDVGRVNVIMSDSDALWLGDPAQELFGGDSGDCLHDSDIVASRGTYPFGLGRAWGSTICMGFILLRTKNALAMKAFLDAMGDLVRKTQDDQVSINQAAQQLGIVWGEDSDMRYENSTRLGVGNISSLPADENGRPFGVALLPHSTYTRRCDHTPVSGETTVAHCYFKLKEAAVKTRWMEEMNLWSIREDP